MEAQWFCASNNSTTLHTAPFNPANKTVTESTGNLWIQVAFTCYSQIVIPLLDNLMLFSPKRLEKKKKSLRLVRVLCGHTEPHVSESLTDFCLNVGSAIYINCMTLGRFLTSFSNPMWLNETTESHGLLSTYHEPDKLRDTEKSIYGISPSKIVRARCICRSQQQHKGP